MVSRALKTKTLHTAYHNGLRRCPCCDVQLVWKSSDKQASPNMASIDHIIPQSLGGQNIPDNLFVMCRRCNEKRDTTCFVDFFGDCGRSTRKARTLLKKAHISCLQHILFKQFAQNLGRKSETKSLSQTNHKALSLVASSAAKKWGESMPGLEFLDKTLNMNNIKPTKLKAKS